MNILFTCSGRRNYLLQYFRKEVGDDGIIVAADASPDAPALQEADVSFVVPPVNDPQYISTILEICRENVIGLLISLHDLELPVLAPHRDVFKAVGTVLAVSSPECIDVCFDKWKTCQFLNDAGVPGPLTFLSLEDARTALSEEALAFPLIVKPRWGSASISIEKVFDSMELELAYSLVMKRIQRSFLAKISATDSTRSVMIQECLTGPEYGLDIINGLDGIYRTTFVKHKLSMRAGETDRAVTRDNQALFDLGAAIGRKLGHVGNLDCDVFLTPEGPHVLELNPRFGGGYPFSQVAGANLPAALIAWAKGNDNKPEWLRIRPGVCAAKCDRLVRIVSHGEFQGG